VTGVQTCALPIYPGEPARVLDCAELRAPPLRQVAGHLGEADQATVRITQRSYDHIRPEETAVLPDSPALILDAPVLLGDLQHPAGLARGNVLLGIEDREVPPDDFLGRVPLQPR